MQPVLLSTAYLPNISYFYILLNNENVLLEAHEHFEKQSYRNRCEILSANGPLSLSIPLQNNAPKELITQKKISYAERWQSRHWTAITSAYKNAPYFEFFEDEFSLFYKNRFELLFDYNAELIRLILKILRVKKEIRYTSAYEKETTGPDFRNSLHPKATQLIPGVPQSPYYQVFGDKLGFTKNLSAIDLLFNKGLETTDYLTVKL
ncbi:MAG: WbqC family protein [Bacteroidia bacterium]